jgi:ubiquinone/menaquinone biosynthesis C-methylase UbiE
MNQKIVNDWYGSKDSINEMIHWNKGKLKIWEKEVIGYFKPGSRVLDIGCGLGREAFALYENGYKVTAIDISKIAIEQVKQLAADNEYAIEFLHYNGTHLPFEDNCFDVVIIWAQTFGLLYGDEYKSSFLKECKRVLKDDGILSYSGHDYNYLLNHYTQQLVGRKFYPYPNKEIYWESFMLDELKEYALKAGFCVVRCEQGEIYKPEDGVILHCVCRK